MKLQERILGIFVSLGVVFSYQAVPLPKGLLRATAKSSTRLDGDQGRTLAQLASRPRHGNINTGESLDRRLTPERIGNLSPSCFSGFGGVRNVLLSAEARTSLPQVESSLELQDQFASHGQLIRSNDIELLYPASGCRSQFLRRHAELRTQLEQIQRGQHAYRLDPQSRRLYCGVPPPSTPSCPHPELPKGSLQIVRIHPSDESHPLYGNYVKSILRGRQYHRLKRTDAAYALSRLSDASDLPINFYEVLWQGDYYEAASDTGSEKLEFLIFGPGFGSGARSLGSASALEALGRTPARLIIQAMGGALLAQWRAAFQRRGTAQVWSIFFRERAQALDLAIHSMGAQQFLAAIDSALDLARSKISEASTGDTILDGAALWWSAREVALRIGCVNDQEPSPTVNFRAQVEAQYDLQECRHLYALATLAEFVGDAQGGASSPLMNFSDERWLRFVAFASRRERAANLEVILQEQLRGAAVGNFPSLSSFEVLRAEIESLKQELQQDQVYTWLGARPATASDRELLLREKQAIRDFLLRFRSLLTARRLGNYQVVLALFSIWENDRIFFDLEEWRSFAGEEISGPQVVEVLDGLRIPRNFTNRSDLDPYISFVEFLALQNYPNREREISVCRALLEWSSEVPNVLGAFYERQRQINLRILPSTPSCLIHLVEFLNTGDSSAIRDFVQALPSGRPTLSSGESQRLYIDLVEQRSLRQHLPSLISRSLELSLPDLVRFLGALKLRLQGESPSVVLPALRQLKTRLIDPQKAWLQRMFWHPDPGYLAACFSTRQILQVSTRSAERIRSEDLFAPRCVDIFRPRPLQLWWSILLKSYQQARPELGQRYDFSSNEFWSHHNLSGLEAVGKWLVTRETIGEWSNQLSQSMGSSAPFLLREIQQVLQIPAHFLQRVRGQQQSVYRYLDRHPECARQPFQDLRQALLFQKDVLLELLLSPVPADADAQSFLAWLHGLQRVGQPAPLPAFAMQFQGEPARCR